MGPLLSKTDTIKLIFAAMSTNLFNKYLSSLILQN